LSIYYKQPEPQQRRPNAFVTLAGNVTVSLNEMTGTGSLFGLMLGSSFVSGGLTMTAYTGTMIASAIAPVTVALTGCGASTVSGTASQSVALDLVGVTTAQRVSVALSGVYGTTGLGTATSFQAVSIALVGI
jgi:hypothetical protein